jgi:hypothetical protein
MYTETLVNKKVEEAKSGTGVTTVRDTTSAQAFSQRRVGASISRVWARERETGTTAV